MAKTIARIIIAVIGASFGPLLLAAIGALLVVARIANPIETNIVILFSSYIVSALAAGIIFFIIAPAIIKKFLQLTATIESRIGEIPLMELVWGLFGLVIGLFLAFLLSSLAQQIPIPYVSTIISFTLYLFLGLLGWQVARKRRTEFRMIEFRKSPKEKEAKGSKSDRENAYKSLEGNYRGKILDTSVIIDGRIFDICKTGIVEGALIIPNFVLSELRHIADSADSLKRNRGRRGLDILNKIQKELEIPVIVENKDYDDISEVDAKLLKLAQDINGIVVTNDYNLNKVAAVQGVTVLNINELANAIKPVVLPGEEMNLMIMKDGKELGQGVAYLDDGTMIVVDGGKRHINKQVDVVVTSVLQTAAGRMIFAKIK